MNNDSHSILKKLLQYISKPSYILNWLLFHFGQVFSDKTFLLLKYRLIFGKKLNLKNPLTFNEKIQWLKLYDQKPEYTQMADKYEVRKYISEKIGEEYLIPLLDIDSGGGGGVVWNTFSDINLDVFPNQFVLKCTHDSGSVIICKDKNTFDIKKARKKINLCLNKNFYWPGREWVYKNIKPRIIAEKYMVDESGTELKDYKIFCFNGEPKIIQVDFDRFTDHKRNIYSSEWEYQSCRIIYPNSDIIIPKPPLLNIMLDFARKLSIKTVFLRTDFYVINEKIYVGELTFYPESGYGNFIPEEWDKTLGDWINLPV